MQSSRKGYREDEEESSFEEESGEGWRKGEKVEEDCGGEGKGRVRVRTRRMRMRRRIGRGEGDEKEDKEEAYEESRMGGRGEGKNGSEDEKKEVRKYKDKE